MLERSRATELRVVARLDASPRYAGSSHDEAVARTLGFRGALIPGAFVYGYMSRFAIATWGLAWAERGTITARFRRPVYDGDALVVQASPLRDDNGAVADMSVRNAAGEEVASGAIGLPATAPAMPDLARFSVQPIADPPPAIAAGALQVGHHLGTRDAVLTPSAFAESLDAFGETHAIHRAQRVVHSGCLLRVAMGDTNQSCRFPTPVIFVATRTQHLGIARPGDRLATSGVVTAAYERKGQHYFESDELLIADGARPIARFHRTSIYAARTVAAQQDAPA
jgi:acyl dehydratase